MAKLSHDSGQQSDSQPQAVWKLFCHNYGLSVKTKKDLEVIPCCQYSRGMGKLYTLINGIQTLCDITTVNIISCGSFYGDSIKFVDSTSKQSSMDSVSIKQQKGMDPASIK